MIVDSQNHSKVFSEDIMKKQVKSRRKGSFVQKKSLLNSEAVLCEVDIDKFCPKKIYDIVFLSATDSETDEALKRICEVSREYEELSLMTIIYQDEILDLINTYHEIQFPTCLMNTLEDTCALASLNGTNNTELTSMMMAELTKLKLIHVMYNHYLKELDKMDKRKILENELNQLTRTGDRHVPKQKETHKQSKATLSEKSLTSSQTLRPIENEYDIIFDDDISNHVWFYVFYGIYEPEVLHLLNSQFKVNIRAIVKIDKETMTVNEKPEDPFSHFWTTVNGYLDGPHRKSSFENTILMQYTLQGSDYGEMFRELLYSLKNISEIKLKHLNYIRHLDILKQNYQQHVLPAKCFDTYITFLKNVPCELVDHLLVLGTVLEEVSLRFHENSSKQIAPTAKSSSSSIKLDKFQCVDPGNVKNMFRYPVKRYLNNASVRIPVTFLAHEYDILNITLKSYNKQAVTSVDAVMKLIGKLESVQIIECMDEFTCDLVHKHDLDPAIKIGEGSESMLHFLYLYLFSLFGHRTEDIKVNVEQNVDNLEVYNRVDFVESCQTEVELVKDDDAKEEEQGNVNLYDTFVMDYVWREHIPSNILFQELVRAENEFVYKQEQYCDETNSLLIEYSNGLDSFGINTKIYEAVLITPVCLRDFCKYVTVEQAAWLENNKPPKYYRKYEASEPCPGAKKIVKQDLFKEYRHLLDAQIKSELDAVVEKDEEIRTVTFEEQLQVLVDYPPKCDLNEQCSKDNPKLLGYDLGNTYFAARGVKTTFVSHDNVKITIDNTKLIHEEDKCSAVIDFDGNSLVFHSNKLFLEDDLTFHTNLEDGTLILFIVHDIKRKIIKIPDPSLEIDSKRSIIEEQHSDLIDQNMETVPKVMTLEKEYLDKQFPQFSMMTDNTDDDILEQLKQSVMAKNSIYKVNKNLKYLKRCKPQIQIPLSSVLNRVLNGKIHKRSNVALFKRLYTATGGCATQIRTKNNLMDFRISRPNGLYISTYQSKIKENYIEIKQEFLDRSFAAEAVRHEEFRLFTREGFILIKKVDGSITLLKASGDEIRYEYPNSKDSDIRNSNLKFCHCKTLDDYRKKFNRMFQDKTKQDVYISRRAHLRTKRGYIINEDIMNIYRSTKTPYLKTTSIKFNGQRISLRDNKITEKQLYYTTFEQDFTAQEIYFERTDGFQTIFDKFGTQKVRYPDGTRISSSIHVARKLVDGYVYVSLNFQYEHPCYMTVIYKHDNSCKLILNENSTLVKNENETLQLNVATDVTVDVTQSEVMFKKKCSNCNLTFDCDVNIAPFQSKHINYSDNFLHATDSYDKHFYADFAGKCKRNNDFQKSHLNSAGCDHYKGKIYKKLFIMNRNDMSGEYFWTDAMIQNKKNEWEYQERILDNNNIVKVVTFQKKIFKDFCKRYINTSILQDDLTLSKYKRIEKPELHYTMFRSVKQILTKDDTTNLLSCLLDTLQRYDISNTIANRVESLLNMRTLIRNQFLADECKSQAEIAAADTHCKCIKRRLSMVEKMAIWQRECKKYWSIVRKNYIPPYFESQFCEIK